MAWIKYTDSRKKTGYICLNPALKTRRQVNPDTGDIVYFDPKEYPSERYDRWGASDFIDVHETRVIYVCTDHTSYNYSAWYDQEYNYIKRASLGLKTNVPSDAYYLRTSSMASTSSSMGTDNFYLIMEVYDG